MQFKIEGGIPLNGNVFVQGAKNAVLPMIAGALLADSGTTVIHNVPPLNDVFISINIAKELGADVSYYSNEKVLTINSASINKNVLEKSLTSQSRASVLFLSPILCKTGAVEAEEFGGCAIGPRRLDFHHNGLKRLGAKITDNGQSLIISAEKLIGNTVYLDFPSQSSTENLMMAGAMAEGITIIENAASEPEVVDFGKFLSKMGAKFHGVGTRTILIEGVKKLNAIEYTVMDDRLDAAPFIMAAAATKGDITLVGVNLDEIRILTIKLEQMGVSIKTDGKLVRVKGPQTLTPVNAITWPHPGLSTDFLPSLTAISSIASGTSYFRENVFEDRFTQLEGLSKFGAVSERKSQNMAVVHGVKKLVGAKVHAPDLRAGMAYVVAGLIAEGTTFIDNIYQIERGHSLVENRFSELGANIIRVNN